VVLEFPESVDESTAKNILKHWQRRHGGAQNASRPALLDRGGKVSPFSISNKDAEFTASRQFTKGEIAGWFHLPPHKVGDLSHATFSNIEQQSIDYVIYSLMPWLVRWHEECNAKLFRPSEIEADSHYAEFNVRALLRGAFADQMAGFQIGLGCGVYNHDEVRDMLNMNRLPDGLGQQFYHSQNMIPLGSDPQPKPIWNPAIWSAKAPRSSARTLNSA
jgi:HK97 family phage portal protein